MSARNQILAEIVSPMLAVWGVVWILGFGVSQFWPEWSGPVWAVVTSLGGLASIWNCWRRPPLRSPHSAKIGLGFLVLFLFAGIWALLLWPFNTARIGPYICTVAMFAYVVGGIWFGRFFAILGSVVTVLTLVGVFTFPDWVNLWMAVVAGGSLLASGLYLRRARP